MLSISLDICKLLILTLDNRFAESSYISHLNSCSELLRALSITKISIRVNIKQSVGTRNDKLFVSEDFKELSVMLKKSFRPT